MISKEQKKTILVVDDDKHFVKILNDWFSSRGFLVIVAFNGKDALDLFKKTNTDLVLLDALIPKLDGFKTCEAMKKIESKRDIPIIMMSAIYKNVQEATLAKTKYGATEYMTKPLDLLQLYNKVSELLSKKDSAN